MQCRILNSPLLSCGTVLLFAALFGTTSSGADPSPLSSAGEQAYERGLAQLKASRFEEAIQSFSECIELHPDFPDAYVARAEAYQGQEPQLQTQDDRDRIALRILRDRGKAAELRAERKLLEDLESPSRIRIPFPPFVLFGGYLGAWGLLFYFWKAKHFSLVWPILGFLFCGPLALVCLGLYCLFADGNVPTVDLPFRDHPLEVALRSNAKSDTGDASSEDSPPSTACPNCGRVNATTTRICPTCEYRIR